MRLPRLPLVLSLLVIVVSWGGVAVWTGGTAQGGDRTVHADLGRTLAREALKRLGSGGGITVLCRDTTTFPQPAMDIAVDAFEREVRRAGAVLKATKTLQEDPLRPPQVPPGDFHEALRRAAPGDVVVSFMGPPVFLEEQRVSLGAVKAKVVALCTGPMDTTSLLRSLGDQGLLGAAIVPRPPGRTTASGRTFEELFVVLDMASSGPANREETR
jgi:hypothetical protein